MSQHDDSLNNPEPNKEPAPYRDIPFGFQWGSAIVTRVAELRGSVVLSISTPARREIQVAVSPKGQSIRVFEVGGKRKVLEVTESRGF